MENKKEFDSVNRKYKYFLFLINSIRLIKKFDSVFSFDVEKFWLTKTE